MEESQHVTVKSNRYPLQRRTIPQVPQSTASILPFFDLVVFFCLNSDNYLKFLSSTLYVELQMGIVIA